MVPGCHLLLFTSPAHVLVPLHVQEPLKKLWVSPPCLVEGQESFGTSGLVARAWEEGGESSGMLLHAPFPVLCSFAAAGSCHNGCEGVTNKRAEPSAWRAQSCTASALARVVC